MTVLIDADPGSSALLMGNEAIVRGALEAGVNVAASYPGTPSSEIIGNLAGVSKERNLYVEWSVNEKVAAEVAAAADRLVKAIEAATGDPSPSRRESPYQPTPTAPSEIDLTGKWQG